MEKKLSNITKAKKSARPGPRRLCAPPGFVTDLSNPQCELDVDCVPAFLTLPDGEQLILRIPRKTHVSTIGFLYEACEEPYFDGSEEMLFKALKGGYPEYSDDSIMKMLFLFNLTMPS